MDSMEINKAFAAVLTAGIAFMVFGLVAETAVHPHPLKESVLKIEGVGAEAAAPGPKAPVVPIAALLQTADASVDKADRLLKYSQALERISKEAMWAPIFSYSTNYAFTKDLKFEAQPDELPRFVQASWK